MPPLIELSQIARTFAIGEHRISALDGVSLEIEHGELVAIIGASGSGKSTLLNVLGCLDTPSAGEYRLRGNAVHQMTDDERAHVRNVEIGFVFQSFQLLHRQTALENAALPLVFRGVPARERYLRAAAMLQRVGLGAHLAHRPNQMSGGQRQRTAIARALVTAPSLLLCDEPTGNLDSRTSADVMALFRSLHAEGNTIVIVTHDPNVAAQCDRTISIADGRVAVRGAA